MNRITKKIAENLNEAKTVSVEVLQNMEVEVRDNKGTGESMMDLKVKKGDVLTGTLLNLNPKEVSLKVVKNKEDFTYFFKKGTVKVK